MGRALIRRLATTGCDGLLSPSILFHQSRAERRVEMKWAGFHVFQILAPGDFPRSKAGTNDDMMKHMFDSQS